MTNARREDRLAIVVSGGPAPGINAVIGAATIRGELEGLEILGVRDGFQHLMRGDTSHVEPLTIDRITHVHFRGGSIIGSSRANPSKTDTGIQTAARALLDLGVDKLITIGGDGTAFLAGRIHQEAHGRIRTVHVPKTIDNDIPLPPDIDTFGFQSARHVGVGIVQNIMQDARTMGRWYLLTTMGRQAGHLALGIGKAAGATLTLIPEEWPDGPIPLRWLVDTLVAAILKRHALGRPHGVAVLAEGLIDRLSPEELDAISDAPRDPFGRIRFSDVDLGGYLKREVKKQLAALNHDVMVVDKDIGYELRSADPVPFDMEYCRDLGYCAVKHLMQGGTGDLVTLQGGRFVPVPFEALKDPETGLTRVRLVNIHSARYAIARRYMIRVRRDDFASEEKLARYAAAAGLEPAQYRERFEYLVQHEPPALVLDGHGQATISAVR